MSLHPKFQLSLIREIGWRYWDPIGLGHADGTWNDDCADEYDRYLLKVVSMFCHGNSRAEAAAYLVQIASQHMGLSHVKEDDAKTTASAIAEYLISLPDGPHDVQ